ncbi:MAG: hypothetical protein RLZZ158_1113 [Cyanobacteriota bacterium]|jgi:hypothetical protein
MLAVLVGSLALLFGLALLLLPLLSPELARPRDGLWAAVVLLLGLVLVTAAERLTGAPMLGVLCGGLLVGRLGTEVGQQRWLQLPNEGRSQLRDLNLWKGRLAGLGSSVSQLLGLIGGLLGWLQERMAKAKAPITKKWVRAEESPTGQAPQLEAASEPGELDELGAVQEIAEDSEVLEVLEVPEVLEVLQISEILELVETAAEPASESIEALAPTPVTVPTPVTTADTEPPETVIESLAEVDALLDAAEHG